MKFILLIGTKIREADKGNEFANAIDSKLRSEDLVFATEEGGVMLNENGRRLLSEQKFGLTEQSQATNITNSGVIIQGSQVSHSSFQDFSNKRPIEIPNESGNAKNQKSLLSKGFTWIMRHVIQILIGLIIGYLLFRFGWN